MTRPTAPRLSAAPRFAACTIVAKPMLALARVLAASLRRHHPDLPFFVLLADEIGSCFDPALEPFELVPFGELAIPAGDALRFRYAQQPLSYVSTPFLLRHLLGLGFERILFLKQETLVTADLGPLLDALDDAPLLLAPHLTAPLAGPDAPDRELTILLSGVYNVGVLGVSRGEQTQEFLDWWSDRVSTHGHHDVTAGVHFEQRWLDLVPSYFPGARVLRSPGTNVGHWNLPERRIEVRDGEVLADGEPCRVFRFSGYDPDHPGRATVHSDRLAIEGLGDAGRLFDGYRSLLAESGHAEARRWPYAWDRFDDGSAIPAIARDLHRELGDEARAFGDPFAARGESSFRHWLASPAAEWIGRARDLSRFWLGVWRRRPDLRHAFPDPLGEDLGRFLSWIRSSGAAEHPGGGPLLPGGSE